MTHITTTSHVRTKRARLGVETLEDRVVPSSTAPVATIREAVGATPAAIQGTVDTFRADLGDPNNGANVGSQGVGRRQINWDGVPDADAANGRFPADFFNAISPRGAVFGGDPRISFQVSADAANPTGTGVRFDNLNGTYDTAFQAFSEERLFTPLGTNVMEIEFFIPGSQERATVSGFGAVFTDVDNAGASRIEYFDSSGQEIFEREVLAAGDSNGFLSFLGVTFIGAPVAKVRLTMGDGAVLIAGSPNDVTQGGANDIVVLDDFIYGEPQPLPQRRLTATSDVGGQVQVLDASTGNVIQSFQPFSDFIGPVSVAMGDITGDGVDDIITGAGVGGGPRVKVFDGNTFDELRNFFAFDPNFRGGVSVAVGNVNGDAQRDIIVGAGPGIDGGQVKVINGALSDMVMPDGQIATAAVLGNFLAFAPTLTGGVVVGAGDINGDFLDDPLVGTISSTQVGTVKAINATQLNNVMANNQINPGAELVNFQPYMGTMGGVHVAGGDVNGDGRADIVTGLANGPGQVKAFSGLDNTELLDFLASDPPFDGGALVSTLPADATRLIANIVTTQGPGGQGKVEIHGLPTTQLSQFFPFPPVTVTIDQGTGQADPTNASPIQFTVVFNRPVTGFDGTDIDLSASTATGTLVATVTEIAPMDGTTFTVDVTGMTGSSDVIASVSAGGAEDMAITGNLNAASTSTDNTVAFVGATDTPISQSTVGQFAVGQAGAGSPVTVFNPDGSPAYTVTPFTATEAPNGVRVAVADVNGDGTPDLIVGAGPGGPPRVRIFDGGTQQEIRSFLAFEPTFTGGLFVAAGDVNNDDSADLIVTPDVTGGPRIRIFSGPDNANLGDFFGIDDDNFRGGVRSSLGDINNDGTLDLLVAAGFGGGPRIALFDGTTILGNPNPTKLVGDFFAFAPNLQNGAFVGSNDINGDGFADLLLGAGPGGAPRLQILSGATVTNNGPTQALSSPIANFFAGPTTDRNGVTLVGKDLDGDQLGDMVVGNDLDGSGISAYSGAALTAGGTPPELGGFENILANLNGLFVG